MATFAGPNWPVETGCTFTACPLAWNHLDGREGVGPSIGVERVAFRKSQPKHFTAGDELLAARAKSCESVDKCFGVLSGQAPSKNDRDPFGLRLHLGVAT